MASVTSCGTSSRSAPRRFFGSTNTVAPFTGGPAAPAAPASSTVPARRIFGLRVRFFPGDRVFGFTPEPGPPLDASRLGPRPLERPLRDTARTAATTITTR